MGLDADSTSGRGLNIVAPVAEHWGWQSAEDDDDVTGKTVWADCPSQQAPRFSIRARSDTMSDHVQPYSLHLDADPASDRTVPWARGELDLAAAGALRETLCQAVRLDAPIVIDCTDVELLDGAAIGASQVRSWATVALPPTSK